MIGTFTLYNHVYTNNRATYFEAGDTRALSTFSKLGVDPVNDLLVLDRSIGARQLLEDRESVGSHQLPNNSCRWKVGKEGGKK